LDGLDSALKRNKERQQRDLFFTRMKDALFFARTGEGQAPRLRVREGRKRGVRNHDGTLICQVAIFAKLICPTVGGNFFLFCQNYMDDKLFCQTLGDACLVPKKFCNIF